MRLTRSTSPTLLIFMSLAEQWRPRPWHRLSTFDRPMAQSSQHPRPSRELTQDARATPSRLLSPCRQPKKVSHSPPSCSRRFPPSSPTSALRLSSTSLHPPLSPSLLPKLSLLPTRTPTSDSGRDLLHSFRARACSRLPDLYLARSIPRTTSDLQYTSSSTTRMFSTLSSTGSARDPNRRSSISLLRKTAVQRRPRRSPSMGARSSWIIRPCSPC